MSRPLTGSKKLTGSGWTAQLPVHRGATKRKGYAFTTEEAADRWIAAGIAAINGGVELPVPPAGDVVASKRTSRTGTAFRTMADPWVTEYYEELRRGEHDRERAVEGHVRRIEAFMDERGLTMEGMVRNQVKALQASLTRTAPQAAVRVPDGVDPSALVTLNEAIELPGMASRSTLKRRKADGALVPVDPESAPQRFLVADLYRETVVGAGGKLRRRPRTRGILSQNVANDVMWVYDHVCAFALDHGVAVPGDRASLGMHKSEKVKSEKRQVVSLRQCADIASRLHVVHQLVLWLMRILGLRIGEVYGLRVYDVLDRGPGKYGVIGINRQGGRKYVTSRPGDETSTSDEKPDLKTPHSQRVLVVPPALMDLVRSVITIFHTDADGIVRADARLVPGLKRRDAGGQGAFRSALAAAAEVVQVDCTTARDAIEGVFSCTPHDMRRTVVSDLDRLKVKGTHARRFVGHLPGTAVMHRHYLLDDPKLRTVKAIAKLIQREVDADLPNGLSQPTTVRCTTGHQPHLRKDGDRIDAELIERGWLVLMTDDGGEPLLSPAEAAGLWEVSPKTARLWMAEALVPSIPWSERGTGHERRVRLADAVALRERMATQVTLVRLAEELGTSYHTIYQFVRAQGLELQAWGERDYVVPPAAAARLREHYAHQAELHRRAVPYSVAATTLGLTVAVIERMVGEGVLDADERAHDGRRMITRASLAGAQVAPRPRTNKTRSCDDLLVWPEVKAMTGLSSSEIDALVAVGTLVREDFQRRRHVTRISVLHLPHRTRTRASTGCGRVTCGGVDHTLARTPGR